MKKIPASHGEDGADPAQDPRYLGWFARFNSGEYYEAHEVLEDLWLRTSGPERDFFKGLIQVAGAFFHLRQECERPHGTRDAARLAPAARLLRRAAAHLAPYASPAPSYFRLDVAAVCALCGALADGIEHSGFTRNPWDSAALPHIALAA